MKRHISIFVVLLCCKTVVFPIEVTMDNIG